MNRLVASLVSDRQRQRVLSSVGLAVAMATCASEPPDRVRVNPPSGKRGESTAQRLHRHGVNCMDELEREECAVRNFRDLLALDPPERDLVGDATFRLIRIYKRRGDQEAVTELTRQYWELGKDRRNLAALPYTARHFPADISIVSAFDLDRFNASPLGRILDQDSRDWLFTCDDARREQLRAEREAKRAERDKAREAAQADQPERETRRDERRERRRDDDDDNERRGTVYDDGHCQLARALGQSSLDGWQRTVNGQHHEDPTRSLSLIAMPDADKRLAEAVTAGRIATTDDDLYTLVDVEFAGEPVGVATLDKDELTLAPLPLLRQLRTALDAREASLSGELIDFAERVPEDAAFYMVMSRDAMLYGFEQGGPLSQLMPSPEGLLVGVVLHRYSGVFVRMPTSDPLKMQLMIPVLYRLMQGDGATVKNGDDETSPAESDIFGDLDLAPSADGKAITFSAVLSLDQTRRLIDGEF